MVKIVNLKVPANNRPVRNAEVLGTLDPMDIVTTGDQVVITLNDSRHTGPERRRMVLSGSKDEVVTFLKTALDEIG